MRHFVINNLSLDQIKNLEVGVNVEFVRKKIIEDLLYVKNIRLWLLIKLLILVLIITKTFHKKSVKHP